MLILAQVHSSSDIKSGRNSWNFETTVTDLIYNILYLTNFRWWLRKTKVGAYSLRQRWPWINLVIISTPFSDKVIHVSSYATFVFHIWSVNILDDGIIQKKRL